MKNSHTQCSLPVLLQVSKVDWEVPGDLPHPHPMSPSWKVHPKSRAHASLSTMLPLASPLVPFIHALIEQDLKGAKKTQDKSQLSYPLFEVTWLL